MYSRLLKSLVLLAAGAALVNCSAASSSDTTSTAATTWALSGTMSGLSYMSADPEISTADYLKNQAVTALATITAPVTQQGTGEGENSAMAACTDGKYYRVLCSAWSTPPVSAYGDVSCSGASGSFTVSGLPLNTDITCAVRRSSDNSTFVPFATLELPATSTVSGTSDSIVASGNMTLSIAVASNGAITTTVTSGSSNNKGVDNANTTTDMTTLAGYYNLSCDATSDSTNNLKCKCMIGNNNESADVCYANGGVNVVIPGSGVIQTINLSIYKALVGGSGVDFNSDAVIDLAAGSTVFASTVWGASNAGSSCTTAGACTSGRGAGGENLPTFGGALTWTGVTGTTAIGWATSVSASTSCGTNATVAIPAFTSTTPRYSGSDNGTDGTIASWQDWLRTVVKNYVTGHNTACGSNPSGSWNCGAGMASAHTDPSCTGNFIWSVYKNWTSSNLLPRLDWEWNCGSTGCSSSFVTSGVGNISVKGIDFNSTTGAVTYYNPSPDSRYIMDQFIPNSAGTGGSMKDKSDQKRWYTCDNASVVAHTVGSACPGAAAGQSAQGFECGIGRELTIKFLPSSTTGVYNLVFSNLETVRYGTFRGPNGNTYSLDGTGAFSQCVAAIGASTTVPSFLAKATKL